MIDYNVGVAAREAYEVKRVDRDYFGDDASLRGGSPKYERTAMRWLERYLSEGSPSLAKLEPLDRRPRATCGSRSSSWRRALSTTGPLSG